MRRWSWLYRNKVSRHLINSQLLKARECRREEKKIEIVIIYGNCSKRPFSTSYVVDNLTKVTTNNAVTIHVAVILYCILLKKNQFCSLPPNVKLQKHSKGCKLVNYKSKPFKTRLTLLKNRFIPVHYRQLHSPDAAKLIMCLDRARGPP
jgi:hypothetical protein